MSQSHIIGSLGKQQVVYGHDSTMGQYFPVSVSNGIVHVQNYGKEWVYSNIVSNVLISGGGSNTSASVDLLGCNSNNVHFWSNNSNDSAMTFSLLGSYDNTSFYTNANTFSASATQQHWTSDKFCLDMPRYFKVKCSESTGNVSTNLTLTVGYRT